MTDARGWLRGYVLRAGTRSGLTALRIRLPAESFVSGPARGAILYGSDDGTRSVVRLVRLADGCDERLLVSDDVVRNAQIDPTGGSLYFHLVERGTRADRGVWRRPLRSNAVPEQVVPGLSTRVDSMSGPTGMTLLLWSASGQTLAVQSCGEVQCQTRLFRPGSGVVAWDERPGQGELIGLTDRERFGYLACHGLPCPIVATTPDGRQRTVASSAGVATLVGSGSATALWYEAVKAHGRLEIHRSVVATGRDRRVTVGPLRLAWPARWADAGIEAPPGRALLTRAGTWSGSADVYVTASAPSVDIRLQHLQEVPE